MIGKGDPLALWQPSGNTVTVHETEKVWVADWPDEEPPPLPYVTVAWHIASWWTNPVRAAQGLPTTPPSGYNGSGSSPRGIVPIKEAWDEILATAPIR